MDTDDHGGPAFPVNSPSGTPEYIPARDGMTLRDWFAGQALAGRIGARSHMHDEALLIAADAYRFADAMLAARKVKR